MNIIDAKVVKTEQQTEKQICDIDIHIGVFFDGTNNNANNNKWIDWFKLTRIVEKDHALNNTIELDKESKISNPAILSALFTSQAKDEDGNGRNRYMHVYIEGSGANGFQVKNRALDFVINGKAVRGLGFGLGSTGVVAKVSKAINYIGEGIEGYEMDENVEIKSIHFYVFGFSRGSACARLFSYLVARAAGAPVGKLEHKNYAIKKNVEEEFGDYLNKKYYKNKEVCFLQKSGQKKSSYSITVDFLGIYDTVSAIGFLKEQGDKVNKLRTVFMYDSTYWDNFHKENAVRYGLFSPSLAPVKSTCHICGTDEFRANFALTDIGSAVDNPENIELFLPGCHSDIGGGYTKGDDGEKKTLDAIVDEMDTQMSTTSAIEAGNDDHWESLSIELLKKLGWVETFWNNEIDQISYQDFRVSSITFTHLPKPENQYSNIPLKFMFERMRSKLPNFEKIFSQDIDTYYPTDSDETLRRIYDKIVRYVNCSGRYYYTLDENEYKELRHKFLHFTSTDSFHSTGDIGNLPARIVKQIGCNYYSRICRYVYRGGLGEDNDIHLMDEYYDKIIRIKHGGF